MSHCSFCDKSKESVGKLIVGHDVAICNFCVDLCSNLLKNKKYTTEKFKALETPDPMDICKYLDEHVVGQLQAKKVTAVAITNHYKRVNNPDNTIDKSNILMVGPTGTGKTLIAKTIAKYLDVPFAIADATTLTEAGYVGDDVDSLIAKLYQNSNNDVERTQRGIIFIDEIDKIARKSEGTTVSRDVSGEGVQQALLKLVEGTKIRVYPNGRRGEGSVEIDTKNILFIAGGAFVGLDKLIETRLRGTSMGFNATLKENKPLDADLIDAEDLIKYGMIPEFVGRFSSLVKLHELNKLQLVNILTGVKNNFVEQYQWLFEQDGIELEFELDSLDLIAEKTLLSKSGARGLHTELEKILLPHMFDLPRYKKNNLLKVNINTKLVNTPIALEQENE